MHNMTLMNTTALICRDIKFHHGRALHFFRINHRFPNPKSAMVWALPTPRVGVCKSLPTRQSLASNGTWLPQARRNHRYPFLGGRNSVLWWLDVRQRRFLSFVFQDVGRCPPACLQYQPPSPQVRLDDAMRPTLVELAMG